MFRCFRLRHLPGRVLDSIKRLSIE